MEGQPHSRWQQYEAKHKRQPPLPPVDQGQYILAAWHELGRMEVAFGRMPLSWSEIDAYARMTRAITEPWEARVIRDMSREYIAGLDLGADPLAIEPWTG